MGGRFCGVKPGGTALLHSSPPVQGGGHGASFIHFLSLPCVKGGITAKRSDCDRGIVSAIILQYLHIDSFTLQSPSRHRFAWRQPPLHKGAFFVGCFRDSSLCWGEALNMIKNVSFCRGDVFTLFFSYLFRKLRTYNCCKHECTASPFPAGGNLVQNYNSTQHSKHRFKAHQHGRNGGSRPLLP